MLKLQHTALPQENKDYNLNNLETFEELEKKEELIVEKKINFGEAEKQLLLRINNAIENEKQRTKELRNVVELLQRRCEELTMVLNESNVSPAVYQQLTTEIVELEISNKTAKETISRLQIKKNCLEAKLKELA